MLRVGHGEKSDQGAKERRSVAAPDHLFDVRLRRVEGFGAKDQPLQALGFELER